MQFYDHKVRTATRKACSTASIPPKPKHIRTIIVRSYTNGIPTFFSEISKTLQSTNMLQQYKSIDTLHRVMVDGSDFLMTGYLEMLITLFNQLVNCPQHITKAPEYRHLNKHYLKYMQLRLTFHQKNDVFKMNLALPRSSELPEEYYSDQKCLGIISYIMDLMDYLLVLPAPLIQHYPGDTCKLDCCIPLILDSYVLFHNIIFFMTNLAHIDQHQSVFTFLYDRFKKLYKQLDELYRLARQNHYISSLIDVPFLPPLPQFKITEEQKKQYFMKHPHSVTTQQQQHHNQKEIMRKERKESKERKKQEEETFRRSLISLGSNFLKTSNEMIHMMVPSELGEDDKRHRFVQMVNHLNKHLESMQSFDIENALWKTLLESVTLLNSNARDLVTQSNCKEDVISLLYTTQGIARDMQLLFQNVDITEKKLNEFNAAIEQFVNDLVTYQQPQMPVLLDLLSNADDEITDNDLWQYDDEMERQKQILNQDDLWNDFREFTQPKSFFESWDTINPVTEDNIDSSSNELDDDDQRDIEEEEQIEEEKESEEEIIQFDPVEMNKLTTVKELLEEKNQTQSNPLVTQFEDITTLVVEFLKRAEACEQERRANGKERSTNLYYQNEVWEEGLMSCAKKIIEWVEYIADCIVNDVHDERLIVALKQFKSFCCQLTSAARVSMEDDSLPLMRLEEITKTLRKQIETLLTSISETQKHQPTETTPSHPVKMTDIQAKKHLMESEIKVLQLQRELEDAQFQLYSLRKQEYQ